MVTVVILVMNVLTMPLHLGPEALPQATTLPLVEFTIILMQLRVGIALCSPSGSRDLWSFVCFALSFFPLGSCFLKQVIDKLSSSASTVPSLDDYFEHNMWNPLLELLFLEQANGVFASYFGGNRPGHDCIVLFFCS